MAQEEQQQLQEAMTHIQAGRYAEARAILERLDHPQAPLLLAQLTGLERAAAAAEANAAAAGGDDADDLLDRLEDEFTDEAAPPVVPPSENDPTRPDPPTGPTLREVREDGVKVYDAGTYEMLWDCQFCGTTKLLGVTHRHCPNCGSAQNPDSRYYPADEEKVAVEDHEFVGADVTCPACDSLNSGKAEFCTQCGAPLTEAARAKTLEQQRRRAGESFESSGSRDLEQEEFDAEMQRIGVQPKPGESGKGGGMNIRTLAIIAVVLIAVFGGIFALTRTEEASVFVTAHSWERTVYVETYIADQDEAWCDSMPSAAYNVSRQREVHHYNDVPAGEECDTVRVDQGDGTFREEQQCRTVYEQEPVYEDRCYYTINAWGDRRPVSVEGASREETPYWPEPSLNCEGQARLGCERLAGDDEVYRLHLRSSENDADYTCAVDESVWQGAGIESRWTLEVGAVDGQPRCGTLARS